MAVVVGVFDSQTQAEQALLRLRSAGFSDDNLALVSNAPANAAPDDPAEAVSQRGRDIPGAQTSESSEDSATNAAALGTAVGVIAGGGLLGPVGAVLGGLAGGGLGGFLASRGVAETEAQTYEDRLREHGFLVVVETDNRESEARAMLGNLGAREVQVEEETRDAAGPGNGAGLAGEGHGTGDDTPAADSPGPVLVPTLAAGAAAVAPPVPVPPPAPTAPPATDAPSAPPAPATPVAVVRSTLPPLSTAGEIGRSDPNPQVASGVTAGETTPLRASSTYGQVTASDTTYDAPATPGQRPDYGRTWETAPPVAGETEEGAGGIYNRIRGVGGYPLLLAFAAGLAMGVIWWLMRRRRRTWRERVVDTTRETASTLGERAAHLSELVADVAGVARERAAHAAQAAGETLGQAAHEAAEQAPRATKRIRHSARRQWSGVLRAAS